MLSIGFRASIGLLFGLSVLAYDLKQEQCTRHSTGPETQVGRKLFNPPRKLSRNPVDKSCRLAPGSHSAPSKDVAPSVLRILLESTSCMTGSKTCYHQR